MHRAFVRFVKFQLLKHFPVDNFSHPVMPSLVLLLYLFAAFAYNMINRFIGVSTQPLYSAVYYQFLL